MNSLLLLRHIAYPLTRRSHNSHASHMAHATVSQLCCFTAGSSNYGPRRHFVNNEKYIYKQLADLIESNVSLNQIS